jgi:hypothetical protein
VGPITGWYVDTGATRHVSGDKTLFNTFKEVAWEEKLYMGNKSIANIMGEGNVILKFSPGKEFALSNTLYVSDIRRNLVSGWLLNKFGFCIVIESDTVVLTKSGMFVGKGYAYNSMFKLSTMVVNKKMNKIAYTSTYMLEFCDSNVWQGRLGYLILIQFVV